MPLPPPPSSPPAAVAAGIRIPHFDLGQRPFLVLFELTRACELACRHCRAEACPGAHPDELTTAEVRAVLDDLAALGAPRPIVVLTGGDPFTRSDLTELIAHGSRLGLAMALSPSGTPLATADRLAAARAAGAHTVSFSFDGAGAATHDDFRGVAGSFGWTLDGCRAARAVGLRLQINTTVTAATVAELPGIARLVRDLDAGLWSVFFLVETGRGRQLQALDAEQTEDVLHALADLAPVVALKTTEAPHYRRVLAQRADADPAGRGPLYHQLAAGFTEQLQLSAWPPAADPARRRAGRPPLAVGDGRGVVFVSHTGEVFPSGFLPVSTGNVRLQPLSRIYAGAWLLQRLRDPMGLGGRCGRCSYRFICGGSRARAFAATGDPLAEDPACPYDPPQGQEPNQLREGVGRFGAFLPGAGSGGVADPSGLTRPATTTS